MFMGSYRLVKTTLIQQSIVYNLLGKSLSQYQQNKDVV